MLRGKTEEGATKTTRTKALLNNKAEQNFFMTHPQLTRMVIGIGISAAIGALFVMLLASPEQALAWRPTGGHITID